MKRKRFHALSIFLSLIAILSLTKCHLTKGKTDHSKSVKKITHSVNLIEPENFDKIQKEFNLNAVYGDKAKYLGGLDDSYAYATGVLLNADDADFYEYDCGSNVRLVLIREKDGQFEMIKNTRELKTAFAPVSSPEEALSYVHLVDGGFPTHEFEDGFLHDESKNIVHVERHEEGYKLNLLHFPACGKGKLVCAEYLVTYDGVIQTLSETEVGYNK